jgi:hypothetical protein
VLIQRVKDLAQPELVVGQGLVEKFLPCAVHGNGVVLAFADVQADEDFNALVVSDHLYLPVAAADTCAGLVRGVRARHPRYARRSQPVLPLLAVSPAPTGPR